MLTLAPGSKTKGKCEYAKDVVKMDNDPVYTSVLAYYANTPE